MIYDDVCHAYSLIREDKHVRLTFLAQDLDISLGSVHSIVYNHLDEKKLCVPSVPTSQMITKLVVWDSCLCM
jgi:hypothetical protein